MLDAHPAIATGNELLHPEFGLKPADVPEVEFEVHEMRPFGTIWFDKLTIKKRLAVARNIFSKVNGFKIHTEHVLAENISALANDLECAVLVTARRDLFAQALSQQVAMQTSVWHADDRSSCKFELKSGIEIDVKEFLRWAEEHQKLRRVLHKSLVRLSIPTMYLEYETLFSGNYAEKAGRFNDVLSFLSLPSISSFPPEANARISKRMQELFDPNFQKVTRSDEISNVVNLNEVKQAWFEWYTKRYLQFST